MNLQGSTHRNLFPLALFALLLLNLAIPDGAEAANRIRVKASKNEGGAIVLRVNLGKRNSHSHSRRRVRAKSTAFLALERSIDSAPFSLLAVRRASHRRMRVNDTATEPGAYAYRARLQRGIRQKISATATVLISEQDLTPELEIPTPIATPPHKTLPPALEIPQGFSACSDAELKEMVDQTNFYRELNGAAPLSEHPMLQSAALEHSLAMARSGIFTHDGWFDRLTARGFTTGTAAQNIAYYIPNAIDVTDALYESPGHRYNMVNTAHQYIGVACIRGLNGRPWWTQYFGSFR